MLTGGSDPFYRRLLASGHRQYSRIEVWSRDGQRLDSMLPQMLARTFLAEPASSGLVFLDGAVSATLDNRVARTLRIDVPSYMYPVSPSDLLAPFGNEIRAYYGVVLGDGSQKYVWQVFRGGIREVEASSDGTCSVLCTDRATDVQDVNFVSPQNSVPGNSVNAEWQRLIVDAVPDATFGASDTFIKQVEPLTWEFDRSSALDEMARSVGALWYPLANGDYVIRRYPWAVSNPSVVQWSDGPGGTVSSWRVRRSRDSIFNVVTVTGERLNGDAPVYATATDSTPGSPTSVEGNFGVRSTVERLQSPSTQGGATNAAEALLRTYISPVEEWDMQVVPDGALELGDPGDMLIGARENVAVVSRFVLPLGLTGDMSVSTRSIVIGSTS